MTQTKERETYNGWSNYETWNVKLWLDNDEGSQAFVYELANGSCIESTSEKAAQLKEFVEKMRKEWKEYGATMFDDLLDAALGQVDWLEIIKNVQEE